MATQIIKSNEASHAPSIPMHHTIPFHAQVYELSCYKHGYISIGELKMRNLNVLIKVTYLLSYSVSLNKMQYCTCTCVRRV